MTGNIGSEKSAHMNRKKIALILLFAGMLVRCALFARADARNAVFCIGKFDRRAVRIRTNSYEEIINPFFREQDGKWYYFLPSALDDRIIYNDVPDTTVLIDGQKLEPFERFEWEDGREYVVVYDNIYGHQEITVIFTATAEIPAVFIDTASQTMGPVNESKENTEPGTITVYETDGSVSLSGKLTLRGRGNSTYHTFFKKAFNIKLDKAGCMFGMEKAKDWCLLANAWDYSYMNNRLAYDMAAKAGFSYVPEAKYADIYFNGDYWGIYLVTEKVEVGRERLNITDLEELNKRANPGMDPALAQTRTDGSRKGTVLENIPSDITGGYLLERDYRIQADYERPKATVSAFTTADFGTPVNIRAPKYADIREVEYISSLINEMEQAIRSEDGTSGTGKTWLDYIDLDSWVKWYMVSEIAYDLDKGRTSTFFYKDRDSTDPKIHMGPVWDFDNAFGGHVEDMAPDILSKLAEESWIQDLYDRPEFLEAVSKEWDGFFREYLMNDAPKNIDIWREEIRKSVELDNLRWWRGEGYQKYWPLIGGTFDSAYDFDTEVDFLKYWINARREFLDIQWSR